MKSIIAHYIALEQKVADADGKDYLAGRKNDYSQPLADASYAALIKAESQLLAALSKEIAAEIVALQK